METIRVADVIVKRLLQWGVNQTFCVTGGGAMHLNDAFAHTQGMQIMYMHHEQACTMAAEGYARIAERPAIANLTTGPGVINGLNGVFGAYTDSIPMIVVSGQVKRETLRSAAQLGVLRQLGDQEVDTVSLAKPLTKAVWLLTDASDVIEIVDQAFLTAVTGRPGPVWIDVPNDVQGTSVQIDWGTLPTCKVPPSLAPTVLDSDYHKLLDLIRSAKAPLLFAGSGIRLAQQIPTFHSLMELLQIPVVTAWTHDLIESDHPLFVGRPGTIGTRAGNFVVQNADLVLVLGSRLNIRQTSYNYKSFAKGAKIVWVDIDKAELDKGYIEPYWKIEADLRNFLPDLLHAAKDGYFKSDQQIQWLSWCKEMQANYEPKPSDYSEDPSGVNAYHLIPTVIDSLPEDAVIVCGDATACIVPFQTAKLRGRMRLFSNSGSASMGYDLPAAIGAATAAPDRPIICFAGDGSVMMNIQELQTIAAHRLNILVLVLNNDGYLSIKQTQRNFFGRESGSSSKSGVSFPDFVKIAEAFGITGKRVRDIVDVMTYVQNYLSGDSHNLLVECVLNTVQEFEPRLKSKQVGDKIITPELEDMFPFLEKLPSFKCLR